MTGNGILQITLYITVLTVAAKFLGQYMAWIYEGKRCSLFYFLHPIEDYIYKFCRIDPKSEMDWKSYAIAVLVFNLFGFLILFLLQIFQFSLPLNPQGFASIKNISALNTGVSFITNTNWQAYGSEKVISYITHMLGLTVQNFVSAATGMAVAMALVRGFSRRETTNLGNFWVDLVRSILHILLPLAVILSLLLVSQGVIQNFQNNKNVELLQNYSYVQPDGQAAQVTEQVIPMGPAASQIAIKQLGSNGGGYFSANSAHPFENPTPLANFLEMLALLLIPAAFCFTFGAAVRDNKQGLAIFLVMTCIFIPILFGEIHSEQVGNPLYSSLSVDQSQGNMEGKETRFGVINSALFSVAATASSNGAMNSQLDSYSPIGGMLPMWLMQLGEVIYGGDGSGLYGMLLFIIITVFIAGLMVGRTPEYLGKKIEVFEMKMASLAVLVPHIFILLFTAMAVLSSAGIAAIGNPGVHGFSEILYAFTSTANNNGSAFGGLKADTNFYNILTGIAMFAGRFFVIVPVLAIAGSLAKKKVVPAGKGTLPTHTPLFITLVICVILIIGALAFFPVLSLGPIVEQLT